MGYRNKRGIRPKCFWINLLIFILILSMWSVPGMTADPENCQLCHRYSGLAAFTPESGTKKIFYVNEAIYRNTVHGNVQCTH